MPSKSELLTIANMTEKRFPVDVIATAIGRSWAFVWDAQNDWGMQRATKLEVRAAEAARWERMWGNRPMPKRKPMYRGWAELRQ